MIKNPQKYFLLEKYMSSIMRECKANVKLQVLPVVPTKL